MDLHILYKSETGKYPCNNELTATRKKGEWILDASDDDILDMFGYQGFIEIYDEDYIKWLEDKLESLLKCLPTTG